MIGPNTEIKSELCENVSRTMGLFHMKLDDLLKQEVVKQTEFGKKWETKYKSGESLPDDVLCNFMNEKLKALKFDNDYRG